MSNGDQERERLEYCEENDQCTEHGCSRRGFPSCYKHEEGEAP